MMTAHMTHCAKISYLVGLLLLCGFQIAATLLNQNVWPVSSFNVFSRTPKEIWVLKAILIDDQEREIAVDPGQTLPIEFFKARSVYRRVFLSNMPQTDKDQFVARLLKRIQDGGWRSFDETLASVDKRHAMHLRVEAWQLNPSELESNHKFAITKRLILYASPPSSVTAL
jgi:hypothetical protein